MVKEIKHKRESVLSWNDVIGWISSLSVKLQLLLVDSY